MRSHLGSKINGSRTISTANDADCSGFPYVKAKKHGAKKSHEYASLSSSTKKQGLRVSNQRTKVRHCPNTHKNERWKDFILDTSQDQLHNTRIGFKPGSGDIRQKAPESNRGKQQRFKALDDGQVKQDAPNQNHNGIARCKSHETTVRQDRFQSYQKSIHNLNVLL